MGNLNLYNEKKLFIHPAWIILSICFINLFINYGIRLGFSVVLPEMIKALNIGRRQGGDIFNAYLFSYIIASPFTGYLTDKFGARRVISIFGIFLGIGTFLMGTTNGLLGASLSFALVGMGASAMWTPILTVVQRWFSPNKRGMALGILSSGTGMGFGVLGYLHPIIIRSWNWRFSWYIPGTAALLMVFVNALMLRSTPEDLKLIPWGQKEEPVQRKTLDNKYDSLKRRYYHIVHSSDFWIIGLSYLLASLSLYIITTYMVDYARNSLQFPYEKASLLATIHGFSQIAGVLSLPLLSDHIGRRNTLLLTNLLIAASSMGIILSGSNQVFLFTSVGVLGACYGVTFPMYGACAGDYFKKEVIGSIVGAWTPFYGIGAIVAHRFGGQIRDHTGSFQLSFTIAIVTALLASILLLFIRSLKRTFDG